MPKTIWRPPQKPIISERSHKEVVLPVLRARGRKASSIRVRGSACVLPVRLVAFHALAGEFEIAETHLDELRTRLTSIGQPAYGPWPDELGLLWTRTGKLGHAESQLRQALEWSSGTGNRLVEAGTARRLAEVLRYLERYEEAEKNFLRSLELNGTGRNRMGELALLPHLSMLYSHEGRHEDAAKSLQRAREIDTRLDQPGALSGDLLIAEAIADSSEGRLRESEGKLAAAIDVYERFERPWDKARGLFLLAESVAASGATGSEVRSRELVTQAVADFDAIGATWWAERCKPG